MIKNWIKNADWKVLYKHFSAQALIVLAALGGVDAFLPELAQHISPKAVSVIAVLGIIGKLTKQKDTTA